MLTSTRLLVTALVVALPAAAAGSCNTFYRDLCHGPVDCMCTLGETCGTRTNVANASTLRADGTRGCSGQCRQVVHDRCRGPYDCLQDAGPCATPPPPMPPGPNAVSGFDFASPFTDTQLSCLKTQANFSFGIVRAHHSNGGVDTNAPGMIKKMRALGFSSVMAYLFPCTTFNEGHGPAEQVRHTVAYLQEQGAVPDRIWFDLEWNPYTPPCDWKAHNASYNCDFVRGLVAAAANSSVPFGVYAGKNFWDEYMPSCTAASSLPLWYAAYDGRKSFGDFQPYGGWSLPSIKQYNDKLQPSQCGFTSLDVDFAPNGLP